MPQRLASSHILLLSKPFLRVSILLCAIPLLFASDLSLSQLPKLLHFGATRFSALPSLCASLPFQARLLQLLALRFFSIPSQGGSKLILRKTVPTQRRISVSVPRLALHSDLGLCFDIVSATLLSDFDQIMSVASQGRSLSFPCSSIPSVAVQIVSGPSCAYLVLSYA